MAKTYVQPGSFMDYTNSSGSDIVSGQMVLVGTRLGIASGDIANGASGVLAMKGVHALPKAAVSITQGAKLYYDADGNRVGGPSLAGCLTTTSTANTLVGYAFAAAGETDTTVDIDLNTMNA